MDIYVIFISLVLAVALRYLALPLKDELDNNDRLKDIYGYPDDDD